MYNSDNNQQRLGIAKVGNKTAPFCNIFYQEKLNSGSWNFFMLANIFGHNIFKKKAY